jgi:hypothetical protein
LKSGWKQVGEKRIFRADLTGFGKDTRALEKEITEALAAISGERGESVPLLVEFRDTAISMETVGIAKRIIGNGPPSIGKAAVAIRVSGLMAALLDSMIGLAGGTVRRFDEVPSAEDWLVGMDEGSGTA